jgi:hypothetical protein
MFGVVLSHFHKQKFKLELLGTRQNVGLCDDQADALWRLVSVALDWLASLIPSSFARDPLDDADE